MPETPDIQALIEAVDAAESVETLVDAVEDLAQTGDVQALPTLLAALNFNNPGAAVAAVEGFILVGEPAVEPLLALLENQNYGARAWALRALAGIGDPRALSILLETAQQDYALSVRRAAARGLGTVRWHLVAPEEIGDRQQAVLETLALVTQDPEWVVRYAAIAGLQSLAESLAATQPDVIPKILEILQICASQDEDMGVQARARMAQQQLSKLSKSILFSDDAGPGGTPLRTDWQQTLDQLYRRKSDERRPENPEGDPSKFRAVVSQLNLDAKKKRRPSLRTVIRRFLMRLKRRMPPKISLRSVLNSSEIRPSEI